MAVEGAMHVAGSAFIQVDVDGSRNKLALLLTLALLFGVVSLPAQTQPHPASPITINISDMDIRDFLRFLQGISGMSFVIAPDVQGRVTAIMQDVRWEQALEAALRTNGLTAEREGNVLRIITLEGARRDAESRRTLARAKLEAATLMTCIRRLSNADAIEVAAILQPLLSERGRVVADTRTNTVIVTDVTTVLETLGFRSAAEAKGRCYLDSGQ